MMNNLQSLQSTDYTQFFLAKVVFNNDPTLKQRIKVTIPQLLEGDTELLPWVLAIKPVGFGFGDTFGVMSVPPLGSWVVVRFEAGELSYGQCLGSTPVGESSLGPLETNYPFRYGFRDPAGNHFYVDTTPGSVDLEFRHKSGTTFHIRDNGKTEATVVNDLVVTVSNNANVTVHGNVTLTVDGGITSSANVWNHTGDVNVTGTITATVDVLAAGTSGHTHTHSGVVPGGGSSGPPN